MVTLILKITCSVMAF